MVDLTTVTRQTQSSIPRNTLAHVCQRYYQLTEGEPDDGGNFSVSYADTHFSAINEKVSNALPACGCRTIPFPSLMIYQSVDNRFSIDTFNFCFIFYGVRSTC
ncbi:hypothetical protein AAHC03_09260 [Spirometra sp. Aus1]